MPSITNIERDRDSKQYLCLFHLMTAGLLDENIGSDEQEIIEMIYLIIDVDEKKVRSIGDKNTLTGDCFFLNRLWLYIGNMFDLYI